jgi:hypothetical protein
MRLILLPFTPPASLVILMYARRPSSAGACEATVGPLLSPDQPMLTVPAVDRD